MEKCGNSNQKAANKKEACIFIYFFLHLLILIGHFNLKIYFLQYEVLLVPFSG